MRENFEKLPEVHKKLKDLHPTIVWFCDQENKYASSFEGFQNMVIWLNGAYYAFQEQQKKIDKISEVVNGFRDAALIFDTEYNEGAYRVCEMILDEIKDILK